MCVVYLCKENLGLSFSQQLQNFLTSLNNVVISNPLSKFIIVGDFNLSNIKWTPSPTSDKSFEPSNHKSPNEILLIDEMCSLNLRQYNGNHNHFGKILDLVLSNIIVHVTDFSRDPLVPIDKHHGALVLNIPNLQISSLSPAPRRKILFNRGDYSSINRELSNIDWVTEFSSRNLEECISLFYNNVNTLIDKYIPSKIATSNAYPVWYTAPLKKLINEKQKHLRKFKIYGNQSDLISFKILRERFKSLEKTCYQNYINYVEDSIKDNPKRFWSYIKNRNKSTQIPNVLRYNGQDVNNGETICNAFSNFFMSSFLHGGSGSHRVSREASNCTSYISSITVDEKIIHEILKRLDPGKSAGPDNLPSRFLINCSELISKPIALLFKLSLSQCCVPDIWKRAYITPVHKKGSKSEVTNYRPISKLCIIAKVFEKLVYRQTYSALCHSISLSQHGFIKGRSTVSNLILLGDYITDAMDDGCQVDVVYTDYSKAFDRIPHDVLLNKLEMIGIHGDLLRWFASYVDNRCQAVVINNYISSWVEIPSGVPQGSLLGPLLFVIFVNDIEKCLKTSKLLCFADDMKIFARIRTYADTILLQEDLNLLQSYCIKNKLDLNPEKCTVMSFSRRVNTILYEYSLQQRDLRRVCSMRDLGITHDSKFLFDKHIDGIVSKASKALGFLIRSTQDFVNAKTLKILYCSLVRSGLEYASQVWSPRYSVYIDRIENIQKRFLKYLCYRTGETYKSDQYDQICRKHHLLPLTYRRKIADTTFLIKIISNGINCPDLLSLLQFHVPTGNLRNFKPIHVPLAKSNYRQNSFLLRAGKQFNDLCMTTDFDLFNVSHTSARRKLSNIYFEVE